MHSARCGLPAKARSGAGTLASGVEPEQVAIGLVGVEHPPRAVGDQSALRQIVDEGLGDVVARMPPAEMQDADGAGEQAEHADHGKAGKDGEHERLGHLARHHGEADRGDRQRQRQQDHKAHAAVAFGAVRGGRGIAHWRVDIGHGLGKIADSELAWPDIVMGGVVQAHAAWRRSGWKRSPEDPPYSVPGWWLMHC